MNKTYSAEDVQEINKAMNGLMREQQNNSITSKVFIPFVLQSLLCRCIFVRNNYRWLLNGTEAKNNNAQFEFHR
jgi:hypothetical protein